MDEHRSSGDGSLRASAAGFEARDGDVLVVSYPEVKLPVSPGSYAMVTVGGLIYTRQLRAGDDVDAEQRKIYAWLKRRAEADARVKVEEFSKQLEIARSGAARKT